MCTNGVYKRADCVIRKIVDVIAKSVLLISVFIKCIFFTNFQTTHACLKVAKLLTICHSCIYPHSQFSLEVSLMDDFEQDLSLGLQKVDNVTRYCYRRRNGNTNSKIKASSQIRDRLIEVMQSDMFSLTSQIKIKQLRGTSCTIYYFSQLAIERVMYTSSFFLKCHDRCFMANNGIHPGKVRVH